MWASRRSTYPSRNCVQPSLCDSDLHSVSFVPAMWSTVAVGSGISERGRRSFVPLTHESTWKRNANMTSHALRLCAFLCEKEWTHRLVNHEIPAAIFVAMSAGPLSRYAHFSCFIKRQGLAHRRPAPTSRTRDSAPSGTTLTLSPSPFLNRALNWMWM